MGKKWRFWVKYSPLLLCILMMMPRVISPQFGFFDDARTIITSQNILSGQWNIAEEDQSGRFRPVYWLYYAMIFSFAGQNPLWFFLGNLVLFLLLTFGLIWLASELKLSDLAIWLVGTSFVISGPVLENIYTLSKPELLQAVWIITAVMALTAYVGQEKKVAKAFLWLIAAISVSLSCMTKETSILLFPLTALFILIIWGWNRFSKPPFPLKTRILLVALSASAAGVGTYFIFYLMLQNTGFASVGYASQFKFEIGWFISKFRFWVDWLLRDYFYLVPVGLISLFLIFQKRNNQKIPILAILLLWASVWLLIYTSWIHSQEYYLLPIALAAAFMIGIFYDLVASNLSRKEWKGYLGWVAIVTSLLLLGMTIPNQYTNGRLQLEMDRANDQMLRYVVTEIPSGSQVWINIQNEYEYVDEIRLWINELKGRPDLQFALFSPQETAGSLQTSDIWIISPVLDNQFYPSIRMGVYEGTSSAWNESLIVYLAENGERIKSIRVLFRLANLDPLRFFCPLFPNINYCNVPAAPLDRRVLAYGWDVYRLTP